MLQPLPFQTKVKVTTSIVCTSCHWGLDDVDSPRRVATGGLAGQDEQGEDKEEQLGAESHLGDAQPD